MSDRIQIAITATDGASRVFGQVAQGADRMDQSLDKAERSATRFNAAGAAMGAAIGASLGILSDAARLAAEAEVSQQRLATSIEATGSSYEEYASQLEAAGDAAVQMAFDDEAAADAISYLTQATGDAQTAINDLGLVMDVARGRGIGLAEAAKIVAAAEQGRFTTLRRLGIQLDENATKEEAIAALQQKYAGQAEAYAETNQAALQRWGVELENLLEHVGATTGGMQSLLMVLPGLSASATAAAGAFGALGISLAPLAPLILGIGIAAGAAYVGYEALTQQGNLTTGSMEDVAAGAENVAEALLLLAAAGDTAAVSVGGGAQSFLNQAAKDTEEMFRLFGEQTTWPSLRISDPAAIAAHDANMARLAELEAQYGNWAGSAEDVAEAEGDLLSILQGSGPLQDQQLAALEATNTAYEEGRLTFPQYLAGLDMVADMTGNVTTATDGQTAALKRTSNEAFISGRALGEQAKQAEILADAQTALVDTFNETAAAVTATTDALTSGFRVAVGNTSAIAKQSQAIADWAIELGGATEHVDEFGNSLGTWSRMDEIVEGTANGIRAATLSQEDYTAATEAFNDIARENEEIQQNIAVIQAQQAPIIADLLEQQENYLQSVAEMSPEMQTYTLAMMDSATSAKALELSLALLGENGNVFAPMVESAANLDPYLAAILLQMGLIEEHVDASGNKTYTVKADVADAQSDLDRLVEATERLAYVNILISVGVENEDEAKRIFEDLFGHGPGEDPVEVDIPVDPNFLIPDGSLPTFDIETGEPIDVDVPVEPTYVDNGTTVFTPPPPPEPEPVDVNVPVTPVWVWPDAASGDGTGGPSPGGDLSPVVVPIEADTSGWTSGAETVQSQASELDSYTSTPDIIADTSGYDTGAAAVTASLGEIDGMTATPSIGVVDNASGILAGVSAQLAALDGASATAYMTTVVQTINQTLSPFALGGVASYATGGVIAEMAEWGPELLHFPNGGVALARNRGIYSVPQGTYVDTAPATAAKLGGGITVNVNISGVTDWDDAAQQVSRKIVPALQQALRQHERSLGGWA